MNNPGEKNKAALSVCADEAKDFVVVSIGLVSTSYERSWFYCDVDCL